MTYNLVVSCETQPSLLHITSTISYEDNLQAYSRIEYGCSILITVFPLTSALRHNQAYQHFTLQ